MGLRELGPVGNNDLIRRGRWLECFMRMKQFHENEDKDHE